MNAVNDTPSRRRRFGKLLLAVIIVALLVLVVPAAYRLWQWSTVPRGAPVIGLSLDTSWDSHLGITSSTYHTALTRAQANILSLRPGERSPEDILDRIDALLLSGGGDVGPSLYGGEPADGDGINRERDDFEIALIRGALARDMPILGICRGIQILNVAHGGTIRNLRLDAEEFERHGFELNSLNLHDVTINADSHLGEIYGGTTRQVNSFHGQAVGRVGDQLAVVATAPDGVIEAIERPDRRFVVGMQWHPEVLSLADSADLAVFEELVRNANDYRQAKSPSGER